MLRVEALSVKTKNATLLDRVSLNVREREILSIIGPAGSGKTTFLRCLNRLIDLEGGLSVSGKVLLGEQDVFDDAVDLAALRRRIGMVFALPTPLPLSIRDNLRLGLRFQKSSGPGTLEERIETCLRAASLWDEVKDRLGESAQKLSGGQQQRLCLARTLMVRPEILLLDEPCSGLDPISTAQIEEALQSLKDQMPVVLVTNNVKQASRTSDRTAFFLQGELVELDDTGRLFTAPRDPRTADYVSGRFG